jgi:hypothetical protein
MAIPSMFVVTFFVLPSSKYGLSIEVPLSLSDEEDLKKKQVLSTLH